MRSKICGTINNAIVDTTTPPNERYPGKIVTAGFFGEHWQLME
jgi:hypothetical protein